MTLSYKKCQKGCNRFTLLNLSVVSLPPPFLLFLGLIAKDITGSGTNIEVIASCVLSKRVWARGACREMSSLN